MKEYIDREAVLKEIYVAQESLETNNDKMWNINKRYFKGLAWANRIILDTPSADVTEVRHGKWFLLDECANAGVYCSVCHKKVYKEHYANVKLKSKFCPNCGAKMDGGKE